MKRPARTRAAGPYAGGLGDTPSLLTENATALGAPLTSDLQDLGEHCVYAAQAIGGPLSVTPAVQTAAIDAEFAGLTGCVSTNQISTATVPTAPTPNSATPVDSSTMQVDFSAPASDGGSAVVGDRYSLDDGDTWSDLPPVSGSGPYQATVPAGVAIPCQVVVRAVNAVGDSPASNERDYSND